jgi:hypothetical protein
LAKVPAEPSPNGVMGCRGRRQCPSLHCSKTQPCCSSECRSWRGLKPLSRGPA